MSPECRRCFTRIERRIAHACVTSDELRVAPSRAGHLTTLARLHLDVVDDRADRHELKRHALPGFTSTCLVGQTPVSPTVQALRRQNVGGAVVAYLISAMNAVRLGSYSIRSTVAWNADLVATLEVDRGRPACVRHRD
jgi:hypothetical protein